MIRARSHTTRASAGWMATFADLTALMLAFFVLVFSMRTVPEGLFIGTVVTNPMGGVGVTADPLEERWAEIGDTPRTEDLPRVDEEYLLTTVRGRIEDLGLEARATASHGHGAVVLRISDMFNSGSENQQVDPRLIELVSEVAISGRSLGRRLRAVVALDVGDTGDVALARFDGLVESIPAVGTNLARLYRPAGAGFTAGDLALRLERP